VRLRLQNQKPRGKKHCKNKRPAKQFRPWLKRQRKRKQHQSGKATHTYTHTAAIWKGKSTTTTRASATGTTTKTTKNHNNHKTNRSASATGYLTACFELEILLGIIFNRFFLKRNLIGHCFYPWLKNSFLIDF